MVAYLVARHWDGPVSRSPLKADTDAPKWHKTGYQFRSPRFPPFSFLYQVKRLTKELLQLSWFHFGQKWHYFSTATGTILATLLDLFASQKIKSGSRIGAVSKTSPLSSMWHYFSSPLPNGTILVPPVAPFQYFCKPKGLHPWSQSGFISEEELFYLFLDENSSTYEGGPALKKLHIAFSRYINLNLSDIAAIKNM